MQRVPGLVSVAVVGGHDEVVGHPAFDASVGLRPGAVFCFCLHRFGCARRGQGNHAFRCVELGRRRGPHGDLGARCPSARELGRFLG